MDEMKVDFNIVLNTYYNIRGNIRNKKKIFYLKYFYIVILII